MALQITYIMLACSAGFCGLLYAVLNSYALGLAKASLYALGSYTLLLSGIALGLSLLLY